MMSPWPILVMVMMMASKITGYVDLFIPEEQRIQMDEEKLPLSVMPLNYVLKLQPHIDDGYFNGSVVIKLWCHDATNIITLNAHKELDIMDNEISLVYEVDKRPVSISQILRNEDNDSLTLVLAEELKGNDLSYKLHIKFGGQLKFMESDYSSRNKIDGGFYFGKYEKENKKSISWYAVTSAYPDNAKKIFPCFDVPGYKAEFQISVARPANLSSLSMTAIQSTEPAEEEGFFWDHFAPTHPIPTFAVGVLVADLDSYEPVNVTSSEGEFQLQVHLQKGRYSSFSDEDTKLLSNMLSFLQDYFNMTYPFPKMDIVILPNFYNDDIISNSVGLVIQRPWVTITEQDLKLALVNQFIQALCTPIDWKTFNISYILGTYIARNEIKDEDEDDSDSLLAIDARSIYYQYAGDFNRTSYEEYQSFSTNRGEWFLKMLNNVLGNKALKAGIRQFLLMSMYGIYREEKLWDYIGRGGWEEQTLPLSVELEGLVGSWLHNKLYRYPVLTVMRNYQENTANLEQHTFTADLPRNLTEEEEKHLWAIPITYITPAQMDPNVISPSPAPWMTDRDLLISNLPGEDYFIIMNPIDAGMFLVNYDPHNWKLIHNALRNSELEIPAVTRRKLLNDALLLAIGGDVDYITALNMTLFLQNEKNYAVWMPLLDNIEVLETLYKFSSIEDKINTYMKKLLKPVFDNIRGEPDYDDQQYSTFYYAAMSIYNNIGSQSSIDEARKNFEENSQIITVEDADTGLNLFCPAFMKDLSDDWLTHSDELQDFIYSSYDIQNFLQRSLAKCPNYMELLKRMLNSFLDEDMIFTTQLWEQMIDLMTSTKVAEDISFEYFLQNYQELKKKFYFMKDMWTTMVSRITQNVRSEEGLIKLLEFYDTYKDKLGYAKEVVEESINDVTKAVEWTKKNGPDIEYWFSNILPQCE